MNFHAKTRKPHSAFSTMNIVGLDSRNEIWAKKYVHNHHFFFTHHEMIIQVDEDSAGRLTDWDYALYVFMFRQDT
jgi:hypothetical protein